MVEYICRQCGTTVLGARTVPKHYCSMACKNEAMRKADADSMARKFVRAPEDTNLLF